MKKDEKKPSLTEFYLPLEILEKIITEVEAHPSPRIRRQKLRELGKVNRQWRQLIANKYGKHLWLDSLEKTGKVTLKDAVTKISKLSGKELKTYIESFRYSTEYQRLLDMKEESPESLTPHGHLCLALVTDDIYTLDPESLKAAIDKVRASNTELPKSFLDNLETTCKMLGPEPDDKKWMALEKALTDKDASYLNLAGLKVGDLKSAFEKKIDLPWGEVVDVEEAVMWAAINPHSPEYNNVNFEGADFTGVEFPYGKFINCNLSETNLIGATFASCTFEGTDLSLAAKGIGVLGTSLGQLKEEDSKTLIDLPLWLNPSDLKKLLAFASSVKSIYETPTTIRVTQKELSDEIIKLSKQLPLEEAKALLKTAVNDYFFAPIPRTFSVVLNAFIHYRRSDPSAPATPKGALAAALKEVEELIAKQEAKLSPATPSP